jgi:DNA-binding response OmpR family regulator
MQQHIVIIEDDTEILLAMRIILEQNGYHVTCLTELASIEELIELRADCFVIDEWLPVVSGHIICMMLKFNALTKNIPVILTSAFNILERVAALSEPDVILQKPFEMKQFLRLVSNIISAHKIK